MLSGPGVTAGRRAGGTVGSVLSRRGDVLVSQTQRSRMLSSALAVISEHGYGEMSVARITGRAGVSRRTFYDLFEDREDCFLAAFEDTVARARQTLLAAYAGEQGWPNRVRAGLLALLLLLDREPGASSLLVVDVLKAGPRVLRRRAAIIDELSCALHTSASVAGEHRDLPELTGEGITAAVLGVIHTRLLAKRPGALVDLLGQLMALIVLPYLGPRAAERELTRPVPEIPLAQAKRVVRRSRQGDPLAGLPMRITYRTLVVLGAIAEQPGASNRQIADQAGVSDQGQISKLLTRLEGLGLIENTAPGQPTGEPNRWRLSARGEHIQQALEDQPDMPQSAHRGQAR